MTRVVIQRRGAEIVGISTSGHSGYAEAGSDIVCAAVSSATRLTINALTEIVKVSGQLMLDEEEPKLGFLLDSTENQMAQIFLQAYQLEMEQIAAEYPKYMEVIRMEA